MSSDACLVSAPRTETEGENSLSGGGETVSAPRTETQRGRVASAPRTETQRRTCGDVSSLSDGAETVTVFVTLNRTLADS